MKQTAYLNVSLDEAVCPGHPPEQAFRMVMAAMRLCFQDVKGEMQDVRYTNPNGEAVSEKCAVVTIGFCASRAAFEGGVMYLAGQFSQDCIAILYDDDTGLCCGPRAEAWPFNRAHFHMPTAVVLQAEAA
jgi:hypothetical protein